MHGGNFNTNNNASTEPVKLQNLSLSGNNLSRLLPGNHQVQFNVDLGGNTSCDEVNQNDMVSNHVQIQNLPTYTQFPNLSRSE